jgi:hypothetical protein
MWPFSVRDYKNKAFSVFMEFGPQLRIPRDERLRSKFPSIDEREIENWIKEFNAVDDRLWDFAEKLIDKEITAKELLEIYEGEFTFMDKKSLKYSVNRTGYYGYKL